MKTFSDFTTTSEKEYQLRFSYKNNLWEVYKSSALQYVGEKENCQTFINNKKLSQASSAR